MSRAMLKASVAKGVAKGGIVLPSQHRRFWTRYS